MLGPEGSPRLKISSYTTHRALFFNMLSNLFLRERRVTVLCGILVVITSISLCGSVKRSMPNPYLS